MRIRGAIEQKSAHGVIGWIAVNPNEVGIPAVEIIFEGKVIAQGLADELRPDVRNAGFGDGRCGFAIKLPPSLENVDSNKIEIRLLGTEIYLEKRNSVSVPQSIARYGEGSVFILGSARSGTSVMFLALSEIFKLSGLGESHAPQIFQRLLFQFYEYVKDFEHRDGVLAQRLSVPDFRAQVMQYIRQFYFEQFKGSSFVDKTPGLEALVGAPFLNDVFPAAKFIVMERDGIETIESYRRKFGATFESALDEWASCTRTISGLKSKLPNALFVSQTGLRLNAHDSAQKVADHLGQPDLASDLTEFFVGSREDVTSSESTWSHPLTLNETTWTRNERDLFAKVVNELRVGTPTAEMNTTAEHVTK